ncbi:glycosyltransferase [Asaia bogorensis]|uniref:glycosyltransferase n=1 Tax=Asaia bogorensis TaxID=91915 RepID=UPI000EFA917E|nr:glycosyltransferase [Asaia bogorensis]
MHILHIALGGCLRAPPVTYGITPDTGGHIAYVLEAANAQAARPDVDHITIITRRFRNETLGLIHDQEIECVSDKITIQRIGAPASPYREKDAALADLPDLTEALLRHASRPDQRYDAIHVHFADAAQLGLALAQKLNIPVIYTPHALGIDKLQAGGRNCPALHARIAMERSAIAQADGIIVSTRDEASHQIPRYGVALNRSRLRQITPGVPTLDPAPAAQGRTFIARHLAHPDRPVILAIARAVEKKNLVLLAQAYASVPGLRERANLVILAGQHAGVQPGTEEAGVIAQLHHIRHAAGLEAQFALPAAHEAHDVASLYRFAAHTRGVFVNPARHEPFGLTLLEAASVALPVLATNRGGPVDIIARLGHGLLFSPDSSDSLTDRLNHLLSSPELWARLSGSATRHQALLGWENYAADSVAFYRKLGRQRQRLARPAPRRLATTVLPPGSIAPSVLPLPAFSQLIDSATQPQLSGWSA